MGGILFDISQEIIDSQHPAMEVIRHRGPLCNVKHFPEAGFNVSLGVRHSPFTDLTATGHQPISYEDGDCWIVLDGEIYNYREIRRQLAGEGYSFKSNSDAETALAAYCRWGSKCMRYFRGVFALVIYHRIRRQFFLARDRVGAKPFYFINQNNCFRIGSEIRQFFSAPDFQAQVNSKMLYGYLLSGWCRYDAKTLWQGVYELSPGHYIEEKLDRWQPGRALQSHCWYRHDFSAAAEELDFAAAAAEYRRRFDEVMAEQLRHDYPVGYHLSDDLGAAITAAVGSQSAGNHPIKTFSLTNEYNYPDNIHLIRRLRKSFRAEEHLCEFHHRDFLMEFDRMVYANEFPLEFGRHTFSWMLYVTNAACRGRIIFDSEGAEQFLCSNVDFYRTYVNRKKYDAPAAGCIAEFIRQRRCHHSPWLQLFRKWHHHAFDPQRNGDMDAVNSAALWERFPNDPGFLTVGIKSEIPDLLRADFRHLTETLLFLDRCATHGGGELRHPFLDLRLTEFSLQLPLSFKLADGIPLVILRESFADLLPATLLKNSDPGSDGAATDSHWRQRLIHTMLLANIDDILREPYVNRDKLLKMVHAFSHRHRPFPILLWRLIAVNCWKKAFNLT
ncbi:MAG: asparagine synthase-related protein [Victivallales bacterium]|nr:asparagine synthase-related protein [Victivallales bacterium]